MKPFQTEYFEELLANKKLVLLLDLDLTLVECSDKATQKGDFIVENAGKVKVRPLAIEFLKGMSTLFDIYVCTMASDYYANVVVDYIDPQESYIKRPLFASAFFKDKSTKMNVISDVFEEGKDMVFIVDDSSKFWDFGLNVRTITRFFGFSKPNAVPSFLDESFAQIQKSLIKIHSEFFLHDEKYKRPFMRFMMKNLYKSVFEDKRFAIHSSVNSSILNCVKICIYVLGGKEVGIEKASRTHLIADSEEVQATYGERVLPSYWLILCVQSLEDVPGNFPMGTPEHKSLEKVFKTFESSIRKMIKPF